MKKTVIALAILAAASTAFAETSTTTDCGTSPSCVSMGDATSSDNTVSQINPTTASNGNDLRIQKSPIKSGIKTCFYHSSDPCLKIQKSPIKSGIKTNYQAFLHKQF